MVGSCADSPSFSLVDAGGLTVTGAVGGGSGLTSITTDSGALQVNGAVTGTGVTLATTTSGNLILNANVNAGAGTATLISFDSIDHPGDMFTAPTVRSSEATSVNLPTVAATNLGAFSDTTTFSLVDAGGLTV